MRAARNTYALALRGPLADAGFDDIPRDGVYTMLAINSAPVSAGDLRLWLGVSKQAVSQLIDALVLRGYVERSLDDDDRRRLKLTLTERGKDAAAICRTVVDGVEQRILETVGSDHVEHTRATLTALVELAANWRSALPPSTER
jgi:DNA-binding MarR family transcriptional regulator